MNYQPVMPPRVHPRLKGAPKVRQMHWCDFPRDAQLPEMWKRRPVIVLSPAAHYFGTVTVVPVTSLDQGDDPRTFRLDSTFSGDPGWALCDKITTVAVSRLVPNKGGKLRLPADEFNRMLAVVLDCLPKLPTPEELLAAALEEDEDDLETIRSPRR